MAPVGVYPRGEDGTPSSRHGITAAEPSANGTIAIGTNIAVSVAAVTAASRDLNLQPYLKSVREVGFPPLWYEVTTMSDFLEEVLSAPPPSHRRAPALGLSTTRRYALMLTVMAGMTAVPTWLVLKAGSDSLSSSAPPQVSPLLAPPASQALQDPPRVRDEPVPVKQTPKIVAPEPAPPSVKESPVEEHTAVVKTKKRPVHKPSRTPGSPSPSTPSSSTSPSAPASPWPSGTGQPSTPGSGSPGSASLTPSAVWPAVPGHSGAPNGQLFPSGVGHPSSPSPGSPAVPGLPGAPGSSGQGDVVAVDTGQLKALLEAELRAELSKMEQEIRDEVRKELSGLVRMSPGSGAPAR